jgi:hypothetical protein
VTLTCQIHLGTSQVIIKEEGSSSSSPAIVEVGFCQQCSFSVDTSGNEVSFDDCEFTDGPKVVGSSGGSEITYDNVAPNECCLYAVRTTFLEHPDCEQVDVVECCSGGSLWVGSSVLISHLTLDEYLGDDGMHDFFVEIVADATDVESTRVFVTSAERVDDPPDSSGRRTLQGSASDILEITFVVFLEDAARAPELNAVVTNEAIFQPFAEYVQKNINANTANGERFVVEIYVPAIPSPTPTAGPTEETTQPTAEPTKSNPFNDDNGDIETTEAAVSAGTFSFIGLLGLLVLVCATRGTVFFRGKKFPTADQKADASAGDGNDLGGNVANALEEGRVQGPPLPMEDRAFESDVEIPGSGVPEEEGIAVPAPELPQEPIAAPPRKSPSPLLEPATLPPRGEDSSLPHEPMTPPPKEDFSTQQIPVTPPPRDDSGMQHEPMVPSPSQLVAGPPAISAEVNYCDAVVLETERPPAAKGSPEKLAEKKKRKKEKKKNKKVNPEWELFNGDNVDTTTKELDSTEKLAKKKKRKKEKKDNKKVNPEWELFNGDNVDTFEGQKMEKKNNKKVNPEWELFHEGSSDAGSSSHVIHSASIGSAPSTPLFDSSTKKKKKKKKKRKKKLEGLLSPEKDSEKSLEKKKRKSKSKVGIITQPEAAPVGAEVSSS